MKAPYIQTWEKQQETVTQISSGVTYTSLRLASRKLQEAVEICTIDLSDPHTEVQVASAKGGVGQLATVRELAREYLDQNQQVVAALNGDFFSHLGVPSGLQIVNGEIICSPLTNKVAMVIMADRTVRLLQNIQMLGSLKTSQDESIAVDAVNRTRGLNHSNHLFIYNNHFGKTTNTPEGGVEVVCECLNSEASLRPGKTLALKVLQIAKQGNSAILQGGVVLSASSEKATWLQENLKKGDSLELTISYDQGVNGAKQVLSGNSGLAYPLIKDGQLAPEVLDENDPFYSDRHPRTMVAFKDNKLHIVVIDGRQPGYSDGLTLAESAYYLKSIGMEQAINIDGGGSSTYLYRPLGEKRLELANRPSDGFERSVGNGLVILNTAKPTALASLYLEPVASGKVLKGSTISFTAKGVDQNLNPVPLHSTKLDWKLTGNIGRLLADGSVSVESEAEHGVLRVAHGQICAEIDLFSVDSVSELTLETARAVVEPGSIARFHLGAWDQDGQKILLSPDAATWSIEGEIGAISPMGELTVGEKTGSGVVIARYGPITARKKIQVGQDPLVLVNFESTKGLKLLSRNVVEGSVSFSQVSRPNPIRFGAFSGKVTYDFTGQTGHSSVSIALLNEDGEIGREIPGEPKRFGLWVYGDGQGHWLRLVTTDGAANNRNFDFTPLGGLDWVGWRYVTLNVPPNTVYPITVRSIVIIEPNDANKNAGTIYFDHFRAEYVDLKEDTEGPILSHFKPDPKSYVGPDLTTISFKVEDNESGVNANSIRMWVNHRLVETKYNGEGVVTYQSEDSLAPGEYEIQVEATDNAGNPCLPVDWNFQVGTQDIIEKRGSHG